MRKRRGLLMLLVAGTLLAAGTGVTLGIGRSRSVTHRSLGTQAALAPPQPAQPRPTLAPPAPPKPTPTRPRTKHEQAVASALATIQLACDLLKRTDLTGYEVAQKLGTPLGALADYGDPKEIVHIGFVSPHPLFGVEGEYARDPDVRGAPGAPALISVRLPLRNYGDLKLSDLETAFGPAFLFAEGETLSFAPQPADTGPVHCQVDAETFDSFPFDEETGRISDKVDRSRIGINEVTIRRGTLDRNNHLWPGSTTPPPELPYQRLYPPPRPRQPSGSL